ncbi:MAG: site-specific DNA-methyltransferase [Ignavibacteriales bacterium]|nr:site-specific DNA-methyltransferase [Ignavibacteriales bacterium]
MDGKSLNIKSEQLDKLKSLFPDVMSEGKIDFDKLKLTLGEDLTISDERYVLNWAGKSEAFRAIQTPTTATLKQTAETADDVDKNDTKKINQRNHLISEINGSDNIFIEGENLEVLKVLQKSYYNKVKMIYIDPPYNTGNDNFIYPDKFSETKEEYLKRIGEMDEEGYLTKEGLFRKNSKDSGRYHSNWLSMMYPRLFLARNLLRDDGVIFVSIDDNEVHNLRLLMNEIFGEENFVAEFIWHSRQNVDSRSLTGASIDHEYVICYGKNTDSKIRGKEINKEKYSNPDNDPRGPWMSSPMDGIATKERRPNLHYTIVNVETGLEYNPSPDTGWRFQKSTIEELIKEKRIIWPKNPASKPRFKRYLNELTNEFTGFSSMLDVDFTSEGTKELRTLMGMETLKFPKPVSLVKQMIMQGSDNGGLVLDFFAGSGTTAQAVLELNREDGGNRKFILVQLPEKTDEESEAYKAGYKTIAEICKERIRRVIKKMSEPQMTADDADKNDKKGKQEELSLRDKDVGRNAVSTKSDSANRSTTDLGFNAFRLEPSNFKIWRTDTIENEEDLKKQMEAFADPVKASSTEENMAWEILLKSGYELTTNVETILLGGSSTPDQNRARKGREQSSLPTNGVRVYSIADGEMIVALNSINEKVIEEIIKRKPKQFICLDKLFNGNDQLKTNTVLQMRDAGIGFETV